MSEKSILFIETPRAAKLNHRFIATDDYEGGDSHLSTWADLARQSKEEDCFFFGKEVRQPNTGRIGYERLILANVDSSKLQEDSIKKINDFLKEKFEEVEKLVTENIDWQKNSSSVVKSDKLTQWLKELTDSIGELPVSKERLNEQSQPTTVVIEQPSKTKSYSSWLKRSILVFILLIIGIIAYACMKNEYISICLQMPIHEDIPPPHNPDDAKNQSYLDKMRRLVVAIDGDNEDKVTSELVTLLKAPETSEHISEDWKNGLGKDIPDSGPWPLSIMIRSLPNGGNLLLRGLWGDNAEKLQIADHKGSLNMLVECRNSVRKLFVKNSLRQYTPFFQKEDFGNNTEPLVALEHEIQSWHPDVIQAYGGCEHGTAKSSETLINRINKCMFSPKGIYEKDKDLKNIQLLAKTCEKVISKEFKKTTTANTPTSSVSK